MSRSRRRGSAAKRANADRAASRKFWGEHSLDDPSPIHASTDPSAMVLSLGDPPLRGSERAAAAAFALVYRRASQLALLAATAAGLDEQDGL